MANERNGIDAASVDWSFATSQAFLPPRSPLYANAISGASDNNSFFSSWPKLPQANAPANRRHHQRTPSTSFLPQTPAWVDDLLNDTPDLPAPRTLHRRSSSDSFAFLETPFQHVRINNPGEEEEPGFSNNLRTLPRSHKNIDKAEELLRPPNTAGNGSSQTSHSKASARASSAENRMPLETSSALSDRDSANASSLDDKRMKGFGQLSKNDTEAQSALKPEHSALSAGKGEDLLSCDAALDPKRAKRVLANRQSAQRSRVRKLQYIAELERTVNALQEEVSALSPQVTYLDRHRVILSVDNSTMKQRIAALAQEKLFKDAQNDALKSEVQILRQMYQQQQQQNAPHLNRSCDTSHTRLNFQTLSQLELKGFDGGGLDLAKFAEYVLKEREGDLLESRAPPKPPLLEPIGPSSCSSSDKTTGNRGPHVPGLEQLQSDF